MQAPEQWRRLGAACGLGFVVLSITGVIVVGPEPTDSLEKYVSFLVDNRARVLAANMIFSVAFGLLLVFFTSVRTHLRESDPDGPLPALVFGAGLLFYAVDAVVGLFEAGLTWRGPQGLDPETVRFVSDMGHIANAFLAVPGALGVGAAAYLVLTRRALAAWSGWVGVVAAVALFLPLFTLFDQGGTFSPDGYIGGTLPFVLLTAWVLATSFALLTEPGRRVKEATQAITPGASWRGELTREDQMADEPIRTQPADIILSRVGALRRSIGTLSLYPDRLVHNATGLGSLVVDVLGNQRGGLTAIALEAGAEVLTAIAHGAGPGKREAERNAAGKLTTVALADITEFRRATQGVLVVVAADGTEIKFSARFKVWKADLIATLQDAGRDVHDGGNVVTVS